MSRQVSLLESIDGDLDCKISHTLYCECYFVLENAILHTHTKLSIPGHNSVVSSLGVLQLHLCI